MASPRTMRRPVPTPTRVQSSTAPELNERIARQTEANLTAAGTNTEAIERRLRELDQECDVERALQRNFGLVTLAGITLGALLARPWFLFTGIAAGFMAEHAIEGWCPPVPLLRRLGFRTAREIARERYALKALRGDFQGIDARQPEKALQAAASS